MHLILNTETAVDIKAKMSLNEDNVEKCTLDVHSAVANGDVANGDTPNEDNGAGDSNKKIEQVKQNVVKTAENELEHATPDNISNDANIETSHLNDNKLNQAVDMLNGNGDSNSNEFVEEASIINKNTSTESVNEESEHTYDTVTKAEVNDTNTDASMSESVSLEDKQNDSVSESELTELGHESTTDISMADGYENSTTEKENTAVVYNNIEAESTEESKADSSIPDAKESLTMETENAIDTEVELNDDNCAVNNITDATESVAVEKENNDLSLDTDAEVNSNIVSTNKTVDKDENCTNPYNAQSDEEACPNIIVDHGDSETAKTNPEVDLNLVNNTIEESEKNCVTVETINSEEKKEDVDMMLGIDNNVNSTNDEDKKDSNESDITGTSNIDVKEDNVSNTETNCEMSETEQNVPVSIEKVKMETDELDISDDNIDLIKLNNKDETVTEGVKKELEEDVNEKNDIEEKEAGNNDTKSKQVSMDVDESADNAEVELKAHVKTSKSSFSDVTKSSNNTLAVDEPISVLKDKSVDLIPDSTDDVIFNLDDDKEPENELVKTEENKSTEVRENDNKQVSGSDDDKTISDSAADPKQSDEIIDLDENVPKDTTEAKAQQEDIKTKSTEVSTMPPVLKLSNTLDILSDDEEEAKETNVVSKCINIEDDDDVMLIDEDTCGNETKIEPTKETEKVNQEEPEPKSSVENVQISEDNVEIETKSTTDIAAIPEKEVVESVQSPEINEKVKELSPERDNMTPLLHEKFLKTCKKNLSEMTREELEEFCILKIVESVIDRSSLSEVKSKLKTLTQNMDEYNKKAKMLTKQNRDLQVVLKSIQEDQKKGVDSIVPLKITRSVGMQVLMTDKVVQRRKGIGLPGNTQVNKQLRNPVVQSPRPQKQQPPQIPVPRLVPANNPTLKSPSAQQPNTGKITSPLPNGIKNAPPVQKGEKRTHNRIQSVTVDLTDDEPPAKVVNRAQTPVVPPVRLVPSQNLLAQPRPATVNSPRKVYIPISGPQAQNVRPGQTIMLKSVPSQGPRQRVPPPHMVRMPQNMRLQRPQAMRHPAPLPDCMKQYQPPNWKALPPAPDLKLAKVENGIVISWKIEGYQEDSYEEIASYQLYAYQETASPPNTALWKKIGDVKALPLPMACTLTQFMAGYKYYFAVRAVDIRSRLGPFSLPGSILLLNKM